MNISKTEEIKNKKIKIIHVVPKLEAGGMENGVVNICNSLDRSKFEPTVFCLKDEGSNAGRLRADVKIVNMKFKEGRALLRPLQLANYFRREKPDIVHTHGWGGGSYSGIIGAKIACVPVIINGEHGSFFLKKYQIHLQRFLAVICDAVLCVSDSLKEEVQLKLGIQSSKIKTVFNGVDTERFDGNKNVRDLKHEISQKHGIIIENNSFVIECISSLRPVKNQSMLIEAVKNLIQRRPNNQAIVLIIGDGPDRFILEKSVASAGLKNRIFFLGKRQDIPELLSLSDTLVSTSISEGMSNVFLEAMSSGIPVISTKSAGTIKLIKAGENGFLVEQGDVQGLVEKIELLMNNTSLRKEMGAKAREFICNNYSLEKMISEYESLYLDLYVKKVLNR